LLRVEPEADEVTKDVTEMKRLTALLDKQVRVRTPFAGIRTHVLPLFSWRRGNNNPTLAF
jgi:hypothetical protein